MLGYLLRRLLIAVPVVLVVMLLTYALAVYGPGDPVSTMIGQTEQRNNQELIERLRHEHGYDKPFIVQYANYVTDFVQGDWGISFQSQDQSVRVLVFRALPVSAQLGLAAFVILLVVGIPLGVIAGVKQDTIFDRMIVSGAILADSVPTFVMAPVALVVFVLKLGIINRSVGWDGLWSEKVILPAIILALSPMLLIIRQTRFAVIDTLQQDYIRTARAKGLRPRVIVVRHVLRNAIQPVLTLAGIIAAYIVTGSIFIEQIFGIPGFGQLVVGGLRKNDLPLLMATTIIGAVIIIFANIVVDMLYAVIDPRVRLAN
jgi:ABC-type dipeptide/oligopeptide/nickel transport system permease component